MCNSLSWEVPHSAITLDHGMPTISGTVTREFMRGSHTEGQRSTFLLYPKPSHPHPTQVYQSKGKTHMELQHPSPHNEDMQQATTSKQQQARHSSKSAPAPVPAPAPARVPNFGVGLAQWCPSQILVLGLEPRVSRPPHPRDLPERAIMGPNGPKTAAKKWPQVVTEHARGTLVRVCDTSWPIGRAWRAVSALQHPAAHPLTPVWARSGPFVAVFGANMPKSAEPHKMAV